MPFGFFLPEIWSRVVRWYTTTLLGAVFSLCIETTQLVFRVGSFDVDDLLLNTLGILAGCGLYRLLRCLFPRFAARFQVAEAA